MTSPHEDSTDLVDTDTVTDSFESEDENVSSDYNDEELEEPDWHISEPPLERTRPNPRPMNQSPYQALSPGNFRMRLVLLQPGRESDRLVCDLFEASLESRPEYEALSYVWGTSEGSQSISLNLESFSVTSNLALALKHLRLPDEGRVLWVDALCIDQSSLLERSTQVAIMDCIYKFAQNVIVWLGRVEEKHIALLPAMERLADKSKPSAHNDTATNEANVQDVNLAAEAFLSHTWWYRMWTLQEAVLAQNFEIAWGHSSFHGEDVLRALDLTHLRLKPGHRSFVKNMRALRGVVSRSKQLPKDPLNRAPWGIPTTSTSQDDTVASTAQDNQSRTSVLLVHHHRTRDCADLHDKIYALLGLGVLEDIDPKYDISVADLYIDFALKSMRNTQTLDIFNLLAPRPLPSSMPSWAPDWSQPISVEDAAALEDRYVSLASARNDTLHIKSMGSSRQYLKVNASVVHCIKEIGISYGARSIRLLLQDYRSLSKVFEEHEQLGLGPKGHLRTGDEDNFEEIMFESLDRLNRRILLFNAFEREIAEAWNQAKSAEEFQRYTEEVWDSSAPQTLLGIIKSYRAFPNRHLPIPPSIDQLNEQGDPAFLAEWVRRLSKWISSRTTEVFAEWKRMAAEEWDNLSFRQWEREENEVAKALKERFNRGDFAVADSGALLILPPHAHAADIICSFRGNRSYFVLRFHPAEPAPERSDNRVPEPTRSRGPPERPDYYKIISQCVVLEGIPQAPLAERPIVLG